MTPHEAALFKTQEYIGAHRVLEISYKVPFGFYEIGDRDNVSIEQFLDGRFSREYEVCVLHILLGCGVSLNDMIKVIDKATKLCNRVLVLEHNSNSLDWDWNDKHIVQDHFLHNCLSFYEFQAMMELFGYESFRSDEIPGNSADDRNFIVEIFGKMPIYDFRDKYELVNRLHIPIFSSGIEIPNFRNVYDVYIGTADSQTTFLQNAEIPIISGNNVLYANGGGFFSLNYMHLFRDMSLKKIVVFDINPNTIEFAKTVFELIREYKTLREFLENYLLLNITNDYRVADTSFGERVRFYVKNHQFYNSVSQQIFQLILNGTQHPDGVVVFGLRNCADNRTDVPGILLLTSEADRFVNENTLNVGRKGWSENETTYSELQRVLDTVPIELRVASIMELEPQPEDILIASNIFRGGFVERKEFNCHVLEG